MKKIITLCLVLVIVMTASMAFAGSTDKPDQVAVMWDLALRPLGVAAMVGGAAIFVINLPLAMITDSVDRTKEIFIKAPYNYTFKRPIGEMETIL